MATASTSKTKPQAAPASSRRSASGRIVALFEAIYRFLASLKLAVISLSSLASVLAYATFFESWYGGAAVQEWIYQTRGFALLLAFLGANILCAALIRYPWKKRQTGFVITHAGLLILLAGSYYSVKRSYEGQVAMLEGEERKEVVRNDDPKIRVRPLDARNGQPNGEYVLDFRPGQFPWEPGNPKPVGPVADLLGLGTTSEVVSKPGDPFQIVVKSHIPASVYAVEHVPDPTGVPMIAIRPKAKGPKMPEPMEVFESESQRWFKTDKRLYRVAKGQGPAQFAFLFVDRPELVDDFLNPPKESGDEGVARFHYRDRDGKPRRYDWPLDGQAGKSVALPDSDLTASFTGAAEIPAEGTELGRALGEPTIPVANFKVKKGDGAEVVHHGWANLPMLPNVIPHEEEDGKASAQPLVAINYELPPALGGRSGGKFGVVEVLGTPEGSLYYRVYGRADKGRSQIRTTGALTKGKEVVAFGGNANMPMTLSFEVEEYLPAGKEKEICEPIALAKGQQGNGLAASLVAMTVEGHTEEFWIRRSATFDPVFQRVSFPTGDYEVAYDADRRPLGFALKLDDFEVGFDPGTEQASKFVSKVRLTDEAEGIKDQAHTIQMNEPLSHRGYKFYQASYIRHQDPRTGRETGQFQSVFQVATNPGRPIIYLGCALVTLGAFVQFYMRAGIGAVRVGKKAGENGSAPSGTTVAIVSEAEETL